MSHERTREQDLEEEINKLIETYIHGNDPANVSTAIEILQRVADDWALNLPNPR